MKTAVFIDTMSIQKYIFSSNSLKENIGASYLVKQLFEDLKSKFKNYSYIGGGNALLYFDNKGEATNAMKEWSKNVLKEYPGIKPIIVIDDNFDENKYSQSRYNLVKKIFKQKNESVPITTINSFGFNAECHRSGLSAEVYSEHIDDKRYISSQSYTKIKASEKADKERQNEFKDIVGEKIFPNELDQLGSTKGENIHISVIHIDGNEIGNLIKNINSEQELKRFSLSLGEATKNSFKNMLKQMLKDWKEIKKELRIKDNNLPIRPIIIGGDDITFVCDSRLGLYFTYHFIKNFENQKICKGHNITACGGISIIKTKYPFYRGYTIAEELCSNAKKERKNMKINDSLIDFNISFGGLGGNLEEIREKNYRSADNKKLYRRPYTLDEVPKLLKSIKELNSLPKSKIKKLREVLYEGETTTKEFIKELQYREKRLPQSSHSDEAKSGFANKVSPYIDMIEISDFCPDFFIKGVVNE